MGTRGAGVIGPSLGPGVVEGATAGQERGGGGGGGGCGPVGRKGERSREGRQGAVVAMQSVQEMGRFGYSHYFTLRLFVCFTAQASAGRLGTQAQAGEYPNSIIYSPHVSPFLNISQARAHQAGSTRASRQTQRQRQQRLASLCSTSLPGQSSIVKDYILAYVFILWN